MLRIAVCDDEKIMTEKLESLLEENAKRNKIVNQTVDVFNSSLTLLHYLNQGHDYDLIYLDIEMPGIDGINIAKKIREKDRDVLIIYVSGHDGYYLDLFPVSPFRFIKKPIEEARFAEYYTDVCAELNRRDYYFSYFTKNMLRRTPINTIIYFESVGRNINIVTRKRNDTFRNKLNDLERQMAEQHAQFLRIHQSYLINTNLVEEFGSGYVRMCNDTILHFSQEKRRNFRRDYFKMEKER